MGVYYSGSEKRHIHVYNKKTGTDYSQDEDGKPHHKNKTPKGPLPRKIQQKLLEKSGWDYNGKRKDFYNNTFVDLITYITEGSSLNTCYRYSFSDGTTKYVKRRFLFNSINSFEKAYYSDSEIGLSDIAVLAKPNYENNLLFIPHLHFVSFSVDYIPSFSSLIPSF